MIKAFLFNYGGVVTSGGAGLELSERLANNLSISKKIAHKYLRPVFAKYLKDKISEPELWDYIEQQVGHPIDKSKRDIWNTWENMKPIPEMERLIAKLRVDNYKVGLLSNTVPNTGNEIRLAGGYDAFEFVVLSYEVGYAKPDPAIYRIALKHLSDIAPSDIVFLDDQDRCLIPARKLGIKTILVKSPTQAIEDINILLSM